jgi:two-component system sensor histidine kinase TctE
VRNREFVVAEVEDNGIGIDSKERELIFERFYRAPGTEASGSGLGLPIVRSIATQHHAAVQVRANPVERGSLFSVVFPRAGTPAEAPAAPDKAPLRLERRRAA